VGYAEAPNLDAEAVVAATGYVYVAGGDSGLAIFRECGVFIDSFESGDTSAWSSTVP
jgi:hypothetical protein